MPALPLLDAILPYHLDLASVPETARAAEALGFNTLWSAETQHDPFLPGPLIAEHTANLHFGTAIAVSFARSPTTMAYTAWDLARQSGGRFILGLGTQVKAHIERRFGMPWPQSPVGKLREQIQAMRSLWRAWQQGRRLNHRGGHYRLTLMSPFFDPGPIDHPDIPIFIAGVNTGMAKLAGETAAGFHVHPLHSRRYLADVIHPAIRRGVEAAGRNQGACQVSATAFVVTDEESARFVRQQISFYAATPSYRPVLSSHGWEEVGEALSYLASRKRWQEMPALIDDTILSAYALVLPSGQNLGEALKAKYSGLADRINLYIPFVPGERKSFWRQLFESW